MTNETRREQQMKRYYARRTDVAYVCQCCGVIYHPKDVRRDKYCSRECANKQKNLDAIERNRHKEELRTMRFCKRCGLVFDSERKRAHCSDKCKLETGRENSRNYQRDRRKLDYSKVKCKCCGKEFMQERDKSKVYCSEECIKIYARAEKKHSRRSRIRANGRVDQGINIKRLIKKDNNVCHICGLMCNLEDHTITEEGYFIAGDNYPSIDHVVPLSKGGTHTHDNVRLAHFKCNYVKGDII